MKKLKKPLIIIIAMLILLYSVWLYRDANALVILGGYYGGAAVETLYIDLSATADNSFIRCGSAAGLLYSSFEIANGSTAFQVSKIEIYAEKQETPTQNYEIIFYNLSGTEPGTTVTNGTSNQVAGSTFPAAASPDWVTFTYTEGSRPSISASTTYHYAIHMADGSSGANCVQVRFLNTGSGHINYSGDAASWSEYNNTCTMKVKIWGYAL